MRASDRHVTCWDIRAERRFSPLYALGGKRYDEPFPPVIVNVSVEFDDNASALAFEATVRELLEKA